ncbi:GNAT family N-acetyltransferase [Microvirga solisilvae]|uniref:GNAT family N-acetyltransferase n=1 Tax=Microvirga solisilvae TaxID=2919498 RepID=UPI001FAF35E1|nr:N-acetyltransferase [Microvirga solisilvae]
MSIRIEEAVDWTGIYAIYEAAFGQRAEAELVRQLQEDGDLILSLMAYDDTPAGHIAFSHLTLHESPQVRCSALAPLAVTPAFQKQGIGSDLVRRGLDKLRADGYDMAVVLGDPNYYARFGFTAQLASQLKTPYDGPYLQALALSEKGKEAHGPVSYARAFSELT